MDKSKHITPEAVDLLAKNDFLWDPMKFEFRRVRQPGHQSTQAYRQGNPLSITFAELRDHNLVSDDSIAISDVAKAKGMEWLKHRLESLR